MIVLVILLVVVVGVLAFLLFREKQGAATEKQDPAKLVPKGILDRGGVGPVLAVTNDNKVLFSIKTLHSSSRRSQRQRRYLHIRK